MTIAKTLATVALIGAPLIPLAVSAQDTGFTLEAKPKTQPAPIYTSNVDIGIGYVSQSSYKLGEYTGRVDSGPYAVGNFFIDRRSPYDGASTVHWSLQGTNLGLDSRELRGEYGRQGLFDVFIDYNQIPHYRFDDGQTPFLGAGSNKLTLPANWVAAPTTGAMTNLNADLHGVDIKTERKRLNFGVTGLLGKDWTFTGTFHHEHKDGIDAMGAVFGTNGGNPASMILPYPVDYDTNRLDLSAQYAGERAQFQFRYELSLFSDGNRSLQFQNPYSRQPSGGPWAAGAGYPAYGQMSMPPDNRANSFSFAGAYNFAHATRLVGQVSWTRMQQDEAFLYYTANPALWASNPPPALPRGSLDGLVDSTVANLVLTTHPLPKLDVRLGYRLNNRDDQTPQDVFIGVTGDAMLQSVNPASGTAITNLPYSYTNNQARLDLGYRVMPGTKVELGYQYDNDWQNYQEVSRLQEHTIKGKLLISPLDSVNGWIEYRHGIRTGSEYIDNLPYLLSHASQSPAPNDFENDPQLRKSFLADRTRDAGRVVFNYMPTSRFGLTLDTSFTNDAFSKSQLGLRRQFDVSSTLDASFSPNEAITGHAYFTYEDLEFKQNGCSFRPGQMDCITAPPAPDYTWTADTRNKMYTAGVGFDWHVIKDRLDVGASYTYSLGVTSIDVTGGANIATAPLPDIRTRMNTIGVHADYHIKKNLTARFGYAYQSLTTQDFAIDNVAPDTISNVLGLGNTSPDYHAHLFVVTLRYQF